jgi:hypothetical protein
MSKPPKSQAGLPPRAEAVTEFEIDSEGVLRMAGYQEAETRADFLEEVSSFWS